MKRVQIVVSGRVQGVSFRAYAVQEARALGLTGYVRNLANGDVEIVAEGDETALNRLCEWARKGPPAARVTQASVEWLEPAATFTGFEIRY